MDLIKKSKKSINNNLFSRKYYLEKLKNFVSTQNMLAIIGQRRVGKSFVVLDYLKTEKINLDNVFYINKEFDIDNELKNVSDLAKSFDNYEKNFKVDFIIIDEIQDIENWEKFVRAKIAEKKYKIIITGSNSKLLSGELATYFAGRYLTLEVFPFTFLEYLEAKGLENNKLNLEKYLEFGGMPEIILGNYNEEYIKNYTLNLVDSIILKDIIARYKVSDYKLFEKVLNFLSQNIGSISSLRKVENYLKKDKMSLSLNTISNYIKYLQNCFIINECERFDILGKKTLEYNSKYYFNDLGIRNSLYLNWKMDIGKLLENFIYNMLLKNGYEVFVGNLKDKEIDFIAKKDNKIKYFQICYLLSDDIREREYGNLEKIVDNWEKFVISMDDVDFGVSEGIKHIQAWKLENIL